MADQATEQQTLEQQASNQKTKKTLKNTLHKAFSLHGDTADYDVIEERILSGGEVKGTNLCILVLAALIASVGLNMNSTAVIIGAMLISPLMGGIMAIAYGLATSDLNQAKNSAMGLLLQVAACLVIAFCYFKLSPIKLPTSEIIARTSPTIWDVMIACFGGFAGIIGTTRKEKSNVIPGVAIATALMPPICTAAYGLASGNIAYFLGAMYLFLINAYFICLTSLIVLLLINIPKRSHLINPVMMKKLKKRIMRNSIILIIPSIFFGAQMVKQEWDEMNQAVAAEESGTVGVGADTNVETGIAIDAERLTKELQAVDSRVDHVEIVTKTVYEASVGQIFEYEVNVYTIADLTDGEKTLLEKLIAIDISDAKIDYYTIAD